MCFVYLRKGLNATFPCLAGYNILSGTCEPNVCVCEHGDGTTFGSSTSGRCETDGAEDCTSCDPGYHPSAPFAAGTQTCEPNVCESDTDCPTGSATRLVGTSNVTYCTGELIAECTFCADEPAVAGRLCQYTSASKCGSKGLPNADGTCSNCQSPWVGDNCEFSPDTSCSSHGTVNPSGTCSCDLGYSGLNCNDCVLGFAKVGTDCVARGEIVECPSGQYSSAATCVDCPSGTYANGTGTRLGCNRCAITETSPAGSTKPSDCIPRYLTIANKANSFCTGIADIDGFGYDVVRIQSKGECSTFGGDDFVELNPECLDKSSTQKCEVLRNLGGDKDCKAHETAKECRRTCDETVSSCTLVNPGVLIRAQQVGCLKNPVSGKVYWFGGSDGAKYQYDGDSYLPVCSTFNCAEPTFEVTTAATLTAGPVCTPTAASFIQFEADETKRQLVFMGVAAGVTATSAVAAYRYTQGSWFACGVATREQHKYVAFGVALRVLDVMSDWAFYTINLGLVGDTQNAFFFKYTEAGGDPDLVRTMSWAFCTLACIFIPLDIMGGGGRIGTGLTSARGQFALACSLLNLFFEDIPQLSINLVYIDTVGLIQGSKSGSAISILSLILSLASLSFVLFVVGHDLKRGARPSFRLLLDTFSRANATKASADFEEALLAKDEEVKQLKADNQKLRAENEKLGGNFALSAIINPVYDGDNDNGYLSVTN